MDIELNLFHAFASQIPIKVTLASGLAISYEPGHRLAAGRSDRFPTPAELAEIKMAAREFGINLSQSPTLKHIQGWEIAEWKLEVIPL